MNIGTTNAFFHWEGNFDESKLLLKKAERLSAIPLAHKRSKSGVISSIPAAFPFLRNFRAAYHPGKAVLVDEMDIPFKGCSALKSPVKFKRAGDGFLTYLLCVPTNGYTYAFEFQLDSTIPVHEARPDQNIQCRATPCINTDFWPSYLRLQLVLQCCTGARALQQRSSLYVHGEIETCSCLCQTRHPKNSSRTPCPTRHNQVGCARGCRRVECIQCLASQHANHWSPHAGAGRSNTTAPRL